MKLINKQDSACCCSRKNRNFNFYEYIHGYFRKHSHCHSHKYPRCHSSETHCHSRESGNPFSTKTKKQKKNNLIKGFFVLSILLINSVTFVIYASKPIKSDSLIPGDTNGLYYEIGGGDVTPLPYAPDSSDIDLNVKGNAGLGYNCGVFDPEASIVNSLNNIGASFEHMITQVINSAKGALLELPAYKLAQYMPVLYKLIQDGIANGQFDFGVSTKTCQQMVSAIGSGKNPYNDWLQASIGDQWKYHMSLADSQAARSGLLGDSSQDINQVKDKIDKDNGKSGVEWVKGVSKSGGLYAGGSGQPVIDLTSDTVIAGYNVLIDKNRSYNDTSSPQRTKENARIVDTFSNPKAAALWAVKVAGEQEVTTYAGGKKTSVPGRGLLNDVQDEAETIKEKLTNIVDGSDKITIDNLKAISPPKILLNNAVIQMLRKQTNPLMQAIYINKISEEVAVAKIIDKAKLVLQFLEVGEQAPVIYANHAALAGLQNIQNRLRQFIDDLRDSPKDNEEFVGKTIATLMSVSEAQKSISASIRPSINTPPVMEQGAVKTKE